MRQQEEQSAVDWNLAVANKEAEVRELREKLIAAAEDNADGNELAAVVSDGEGGIVAVTREVNHAVQLTNVRIVTCFSLPIKRCVLYRNAASARRS